MSSWGVGGWGLYSPPLSLANLRFDTVPKQFSMCHSDRPSRCSVNMEHHSCPFLTPGLFGAKLLSARLLGSMKLFDMVRLYSSLYHFPGKSLYISY